ncbi:MAG TPA: PaaI family thioesterase [Geopsychrobacteraceae bacterium]|nr:PaaI family thioesterase [Geopsychrobacteraceae bacterium]
MTDRDLKEVETDGNCFVCGQQNERGLKAVFEIDKALQKSHCRIFIPNGFQGWADIVHGGILASLLDEACIYACQSAGRQFVTAELTVKYRKPVTVGSELLITGELLDQRKRFWQARAKVETGGMVHAEATAKIFPLDSRE